MKTAQQLNEIRRAHKIPLAQLSVEADLDITTVSQLLSGARTGRAVSLQRIDAALDMILARRACGALPPP